MSDDKRSDDNRPTIYDVARQAGVSKSLVSLVLRDSPGVSEKRRTAVLQAITELGYQPSRAAATLAGHHSRSIGVIIDDYRNMWFVELLEGIRHVMDAHGYHVTVSDQHSTGVLRQSALDGFLSMNVDGIVFAAEPGTEGIRPVGVPVVIAGARDTTMVGADIVRNDDALGARLAVDYLVGLGHRHIGHLTAAGGSAARRREGYQEAVQAAGLTPHLAGLGGPATEEGGYQACLALLRAAPELTAILAANDTMAFGALAALSEQGRAVPTDVSLMGYDNSPLAASRYLDLTTVDNRNFDVGVQAAETLLARITQNDPAIPPISIPPALVTRSSTAPR
ncbi:LacI family transcriptional regulator [Cryobacterium melibiosiphilum]|uniref:LacI family transcriptional regulator n=1 Tax=Cryobacterium melibiosiphilum TaxID=995039 RepID=A0A3A5MJI1_9MICO|nr:LacI family DNA-binding transcriptional regulator [Cryobacterium melibiosiphilum]RJT86963.1 LacI family transcriptional regulator [Cryobacterium melibiosiphilum]